MFKRHHLLKNFGIDSQRILANSKVLVIGLGGLGTSACIHLARSGIGCIGLMDGDTVDASNLHRQILYKQEDLNLLKTDVAERECRLANPSVKILNFPYFYETFEENANNFQIILDCTDNSKARVLINKTSKQWNVPLIFGSAIGFEGQLAVFQMDKCLTCLFPNLENWTNEGCHNAGVLGPIPGLIGTLQAIECIKVLTKVGDVLDGLLHYDGLNGTFNHIQFDKDEECQLCYPSNKIPIYNIEKRYEDVVKDLKRLIIDVRETIDSDEEIYGAVQEREIDKIIQICNSTDKNVYLLCQIGEQSRGMVKQLIDRGVQNCWNIKGGVRQIFK